MKMRFKHIMHTTSVCDNADEMNPKLVFQAASEAQAIEVTQLLNDCPYEIVGFYEEFIALDLLTGYGARTLGTRRVETLDRVLGAAGRTELTLTEPLVLTKGAKQVTVKASKENPVKVAAMLQILCGFSKNR